MIFDIMILSFDDLKKLFKTVLNAEVALKRAHIRPQQDYQVFSC